MIYAQISGGIIQNTIVLEDSNLESLFSQGFDSLIQIDNITPQPGIGWSYNGTTFSPPAINAQALAEQSVTNAVNFGQALITQFAAANSVAGIENSSGATLAVLSYTADLSQCLFTGSLLAALSMMEEMLIDSSSAKTACSPYITNAIITSYMNQIQSYLGLPLTS
jgi:hypothetical protein